MIQMFPISYPITMQSLENLSGSLLRVFIDVHDYPEESSPWWSEATRYTATIVFECEDRPISLRILLSSNPLKIWRHYEAVNYVIFIEV